MTTTTAVAPHLDTTRPRRSRPRPDPGPGVRSGAPSWSRAPCWPAPSPSSARTPTRPPGSRAPRCRPVYAANPEPLQLKSLGFHWAYAFWFVPALLVAPYIQGRGAWLANITAFVGFVGISTLPGLLMSDWFDSAIGQAFGLEGTLAVEKHMQGTMWGIAGFGLPAFIGTALCLPLITASRCRGRAAMPWWSVTVVVAAYAAFLIGGSNRCRGVDRRRSCSPGTPSCWPERPARRDLPSERLSGAARRRTRRAAPSPHFRALRRAPRAGG